MPDTYSIKPQIYNISHANPNVDFVTKKRYFLWHTTYTPQFHSPQIYAHHEAVGFRWSPAASFVLCLYRSHIWGRCSGARTGSYRYESIDGCRWVRDWRVFCGGWWCGLIEGVVERIIENCLSSLFSLWLAPSLLLWLFLYWSIPLKKEKPSSCVGKIKALLKGWLGGISLHWSFIVFDVFTFY